MKTAYDLVAQAKATTHEITIDKAEDAVRGADLLIDVREADEYKAGHLPGAVHMSRGLLEFKMSASPELGARDLNIVLYCKTSGLAVDPVHTKRGKQRSVHSSYFTLPVLFVMLSKHYSFTYSHPNTWLELILMMFAGAAIR